MAPDILADIVVVLHFFYAAFVLIGFLAVITGALLGWGWIGNRIFRLIHLAAIAFVGFEAAVGMVCPLTLWESQLRLADGAGAEQGAFIARWASRLLFYDAPPWIFTAAYIALTLLALALLYVAPLRRRVGRQG